MTTAMPDYHWRAYYTPEEWVDEYAPDGSERGWASVEAARVVGVEWHADGQPSLSTTVPPGAEARCFRRHTLTINAEAAEVAPRSTLLIAGWVAGEASMYLVRLPDGQVWMTHDVDVF